MIRIVRILRETSTDCILRRVGKWPWYIDLDADSELLGSLSSQYRPKDYEAFGDFMKRLKVLRTVNMTAEDANHRTLCGDWSLVMAVTLWEYRTSLVYAEAHFTKSRTGPETFYAPAMLPFDYFIENAVIRAYSVVEKAAQLLNVYCRLGLQEVRQVSGTTVRKKLDGTQYADSLDRLQGILNEHVGDMRHAHVHRFDPGLGRIEVVEAEAEGSPVNPLKLYRMREPVLSAGEQLSRCKKAYIELDNEVAVLLGMIADEADPQ